MANLVIASIFLCFTALVAANPIAEYVVPSHGYGASYPAVHSAGVLGDGAYIPGAGFIPGYPFTYMRDSYGGHLPPQGHDGYYGDDIYDNGKYGYGPYGGYGAYGGYGGGYGGYGGPAVYSPILHGGYGGLAAPLVKGYGYRR